MTSFIFNSLYWFLRCGLLGGGSLSQLTFMIPIFPKKLAISEGGASGGKPLTNTVSSCIIMPKTPKYRDS